MKGNTMLKRLAALVAALLALTLLSPPASASPAGPPKAASCIARAEYDQVSANMRLNDVHALFDGYTGAFQVATSTYKARAYNNCQADHNAYIEYTLRSDGFWKVSDKTWRNGVVADRQAGPAPVLARPAPAWVSAKLDGYQWPSYHGPSNKPAFLTEACAFEDGSPGYNCYWDAGEFGDGQGHSFWVIPVGHRHAYVYWNQAFNHDHGGVSNKVAGGPDGAGPKREAA